jgi:pyridoxamine 5'-phosphate oxidase
MEVFGRLMDISTYSWQQLARASKDIKHPWRTAVVANNVEQRVLQRTVVLRDVDVNMRILRFYTDARSAKVQPIPEKSTFSWLFYDPDRLIQLRLQSTANLLGPDRLSELWSQFDEKAKRDYAAVEAPGTTLSQEETYPKFKGTIDLIHARTNFCVLDCEVTSMDVLQLHKTGHRRASFTWEERNNKWGGAWLMP